MDEDTRDEIGRLHARVEYLRIVISILVSKLSADEMRRFAEEVQKHFAEHQDAALNSTFPDSYLRECESFPHSQVSDADQRRLRRPPRRDPAT